MTAVANSTTFQSSFELTGYITINPMQAPSTPQKFQSSFELTGYITGKLTLEEYSGSSFKALSSLQVI